MNIKSLLALLGFKRKTVTYGYRIERVSVPGIPEFEFACWNHPKVHTKFSPGEFNDIKKILSEGDFAIDIGAHVGDTTIPMGFAVGAGGGPYWRWNPTLMYSRCWPRTRNWRKAAATSFR